MVTLIYIFMYDFRKQELRVSAQDRKELKLILCTKYDVIKPISEEIALRSTCA